MSARLVTVAAVVAFTVAVGGGAARAQTRTYGPILGRGVTPDQMIVKWGTAAAGDATSLSYRKKGAASFTTVSGAQSKDHEVVLTGLSTDAQYEYYVGTGTTQSPTYDFATCPAPGAPMDVVFYGDSRNGSSASDTAGQVEHMKIVGQVMNDPPDMVMESGDIVYNGDYASYLSQFFPVVAELVARTPFMAAAGNHDANSTLASNYGLLFPTPRASGDAWRSYYAFTCGNSQFIALDSNSVTNAAQLSFLKAQLAAAKADATLDHVFVWFHHSAYSVGDHGDSAQVQSTWVPLFDDTGNKVKAVFTGHDHIYARMDNGGPVKYVVSGGAGAPKYGITNQSAATAAAKAASFNFVSVHIAGKVVSATAYSDSGQTLDTWQIGTESTGGEDGGTSGGVDAGTGGGGNGGGEDAGAGGGGTGGGNGGGTGDGNGNGTGGGNGNGETGGGSGGSGGSSSGGCDLSPQAPGAGSGFVLLVGLALLGLTRRRARG